MRFWDDFNNWIEKFIFPKSDTPERKFQKKLALHQVVAGGLIATGTALIAMGLVFYSFGLSLLPQLILETEKDEMVGAYQNFINAAFSRADAITGIGFLVLVFGILYAVAEIIREK